MGMIRGSDYYVRYEGARDAVSGSYLNSGTVTYAMYYTADDSAVSGGTGSLSYTAASNGDYLGVVESTVTSTLAIGVQVYIIITFSQSAYNDVRRVDETVQAPGEILIDAVTWAAHTGVSHTGADAIALDRWCGAVRAALLKRLRPYLPEPQTATFIIDAPPTGTLILPVRPVRALTSIHLHPGANGDSSLFVAADLLTNYTDYFSPTDPLDGYNRSGLIHRRGASCWGYEWTRRPTTLASTLDPNRGAVKIVAAVGEATVPEDIRAAGVAAVSLLMNRRTTGMPLNSESWANYSYSGAGQFTAEAAINSPEVRALLAPYTAPRFA